MMLALYLQTQYQSPLLSPGSGQSLLTASSPSSRQYYAWNHNNNNNNKVQQQHLSGLSPYGMAGPSGFASLHEEDDDDDSRNNDNSHHHRSSSYLDGDSVATEHHVIRHIDRNILACQICQGRYREPKVLPCFHTFCLGCLRTYLPGESLSITCPLCGQQSILPQAGLQALQPNHFVSHLIELLHEPSTNSISGFNNSSAFTDNESSLSSGYDSSFVSSNCGSIQEYNSVNQQHNRGGGAVILCSAHQGQSLRFFCVDCDSAVCVSCRDLEHREHEVVAMAEEVERQRAELTAMVEVAQEKVPVLNEALSNVSSVSDQLREKHEQLSAQINRLFDALAAAIEQRRKQLLAELDDKQRIKLETLGTQKDELESSLTDLFTSCEFVEKAVERGSDTEVLLVKKQVVDRLSQYGQMQVVTDPAENGYLVFHPGCPETLEDQLSTLGSVMTSSALPRRTHALGSSLRQSHVGRPAFVTVNTRDWRGNPTPGPDVEHFFCEAVPLKLAPSPNRGPMELTTELTDMEDGSYELSFTLPARGQYELTVKLFGQHIEGSPFKVAATPAPPEPARKLTAPAAPLNRNASYSRPSTSGGPASRQRSKSHLQPLQGGFHHRPPSLHGGAAGGLRHAHAAGCGLGGRSLFDDSQCSRLNAIEDDLVLQVGSRGRGKSEFTNPQGVAVTPTGRIVVADSNNQCVQCFGPQGDLRLKFGVRGRSQGQIQRPTGACVLADGNFAIADYDNKCVSVFDQAGKFVQRIGHGKLLGPKGLAVNRHGHLVVVDNKGSCVFVFQAQSGKLMHKFGSRGADGGEQMAGPHYVAVNSKGHIVLSDFHNHSIKIFDSSGEFLSSFGSNGEGNGQFNAPTGVAVDEQDNILVADWGNSRIQIFDSQGSFLAFVNTLACPLYGPQGLAITPDGNIVVADSGNHCIKIYRYLQ